MRRDSNSRPHCLECSVLLSYEYIYFHYIYFDQIIDFNLLFWYASPFHRCDNNIVCRREPPSAAYSTSMHYFFLQHNQTRFKNETHLNQRKIIDKSHVLTGCVVAHQARFDIALPSNPPDDTLNKRLLIRYGFPKISNSKISEPICSHTYYLLLGQVYKVWGYQNIVGNAKRT